MCQSMTKPAIFLCFVANDRMDIGLSIDVLTCIILSSALEILLFKEGCGKASFGNDVTS